MGRIVVVYVAIIFKLNQRYQDAVGLSSDKKAKGCAEEKFGRYNKPVSYAALAESKLCVMPYVHLKIGAM
jgi:hypothetical protein